MFTASSMGATVYACMRTKGNGHNAGTVAAIVTHGDISMNIHVQVGKQQS